ncbi:ankyrin [Peniophora sp. CONT]|nr:ankyrin [Peniophora sp. CONT]
MALPGLLQSACDPHWYTRATEFKPPETSQLSILRLLLKHGANVNSHNRFGEEPLATLVDVWYPMNSWLDSISFDFIAEKSARQILHLLLDYGANANARTHDGTSVLVKLIQANDKEAVSDLLAHGADVNLADKDGRTALLQTPTFHASESGETGTILTMLLHAGADIAAAIKAGRRLDCPIEEPVLRFFEEFILKETVQIRSILASK